MSMVTLTITYLNSSNEPVAWSTDPMNVAAAMERVMRFCASGVDVITHHDSGRMDVLLIHRVTGMTITPLD